MVGMLKEAMQDNSSLSVTGSIVTAIDHVTEYKPDVFVVDMDRNTRNEELADMLVICSQRHPALKFVIVGNCPFEAVTNRHVSLALTLTLKHVKKPTTVAELSEILTSLSA
jgi:DNA-binding NtrC family response regulator